MVSRGWRDTGHKAALCPVSKAPGRDQPRRREESKASAATYGAFATTLHHVVSSQTTRSNSNPKASICTKHNARARCRHGFCVGRTGCCSCLFCCSFNFT